MFPNYSSSSFVSKLNTQDRLESAFITVSEQAADLVDLTDLSRLNDERASASKSFANQVMVDSSGCKESPNRNPVYADTTIREDHEVVDLGGFFGLETDPVNGLLEVSRLTQRIGDVNHLKRKDKARLRSQDRLTSQRHDCRF